MSNVSSVLGESQSFKALKLFSISSNCDEHFILMFETAGLDSSHFVAVKVNERFSYLKKILSHGCLYNVRGLKLDQRSGQLVYEPLHDFEVNLCSTNSYQGRGVTLLDKYSYKKHLQSRHGSSSDEIYVETRRLVHYTGTVTDTLSDKYGIYMLDSDIVFLSPLDPIAIGSKLKAFNCAFMNDFKSLFLVSNTYSYFMIESNFMESRTAIIENQSTKLQRAVYLAHLDKIRPLKRHLDFVCCNLLPYEPQGVSLKNYLCNFMSSCKHSSRLDTSSIKTPRTLSEMKNGVRLCENDVLIILTMVVEGQLCFVDKSALIETICLNSTHIKPKCVYTLSKFSLHSEYMIVDDRYIQLLWDYGFADFKQYSLSTFSYTIFISEKNHTIKNNRFICRTNNNGDICDATFYINCIWFPYIQSNSYYLLSTDIPITSTVVVLDDTEPRYNFELCLPEDIDEMKENYDVSYCDHFSNVDTMCDNTFINIQCQIVSIDLKQSQYIVVTNSHSEVMNIEITPPSCVIPIGLSPGMQLSLSKLLVKISYRGKRYVQITTLTSVTVVSITPVQDNTTILPIIKLIYPSQPITARPGSHTSNIQLQPCTNMMGSVRGRCDRILSFSSTSDKITCKFSLVDGTGTCNVFLNHDQTALIKTLFSLTESEYKMIRSAGSISFGQHHSNHTPPRIVEILTRPIRLYQTFLVQGKLHRGNSAYMVTTETGTTLKHPSIIMYPVALTLVSVKELIAAYNIK